jgi:hypothetical protein
MTLKFPVVSLNSDEAARRSEIVPSKALAKSMFSPKLDGRVPDPMLGGA